MSKSTKNLTSILVSLDCLLDTRLGTIAKIDKTIVERMLLTEDYHTRDTDIFEGVDRELYKDLYKNRDIETLENSLLTNIIPLLRHLALKLKEQSVTRPYGDGAKIVVNLYPYKLPKEIQIEIGKAIAVWLKGIAPVSFINMAPTSLTPYYCKNTFALMIMYDYEEWLEGNAGLFMKTQLTDVSMFVPAIYFNEKPSPAELEKFERETMHPFAAIEMLAKTMVGLEVIDVAFFSIFSEKFKDIKL